MILGCFMRCHLSIFLGCTVKGLTGDAGPGLEATITRLTNGTMTLAGTLFAALIASGCGSGRVEAPQPGAMRGFVPDLRGTRVMVMPLQRRTGLRDDLDPEIAFALKAKGAGANWILPDELARMLARSPGLDVPLSALPVGVFVTREVNRVGDPLYGYLRRAAAVSDAQVVLIPVQARRRVELDGSYIVEIMATLLDVRRGRVIWFGVVEGQPGSADDFQIAASAVDALASMLLWYMDE
ncbi:MAG: hypothetical protein BMS9Abin29_2520 [Gemmatimonadota bacterium]|nr:MAG: hypothetical protein BMS9Abin29_2520 [Gemmatimonadota bacterium]